MILDKIDSIFVKYSHLTYKIPIKCGF